MVSKHGFGQNPEIYDEKEKTEAPNYIMDLLFEKFEIIGKLQPKSLRADPCAYQ